MYMYMHMCMCVVYTVKRATGDRQEQHRKWKRIILTHSRSQPPSLDFTVYFTENAQKYTPARTSAQAAGSSGARVDDGGLMGG